MADNAFVKIGTALFKHQVKKLVGEETLGVISKELADIGGDKLDTWLGENSTTKQLEEAATTARDNFRGKVNDEEIEQWMVMLPIHDLPTVLSAIEELPTSPDETKLESVLRESIALNWKRLSAEQVNNAVNSFLTCLRSALLPIEKQTLMVIGRSVLRTEDKVNLLLHWFEQYIITGKSIEIKHLNPEPVETWNLKHPYAMPPNFTGRVEERKMLVDWLNNDKENRLFILRALGGFGKSALSWHWLTHDVDSKEWKKVLWWSFYEGDASFEHFIEETLKYLKLEVPQGQRPQVDELLKAMQSQKILLIMDGFERALRAYSSMNAAYQADESPLPEGEGKGEGESTQLDCVNINAEIFLKSICSLPNIKSKVLITTRLTPRAVKPRGEFMLGCREEKLTAMQKEDAVEFFRKQKIKGTHTEIEAVCAPYGYHPLSLRLLVGRIAKDFENPYDIVVAQKLKIDGDLKQYQHHVLEVSYNSLPQHEQKLLSVVACFRSPVELKTLQSIVENKISLNDDLHDLVERGLLHFDERNKKFDLHPIVRRYAYERLTAPDRIAAHAHLRDYFAAVNVPEKPQSFEDLAPVIELYHHTLKAGEPDSASELFSKLLGDSLYYQIGAYQQITELILGLFPDSESLMPDLQDTENQTRAIFDLANAYAMNGQPELAMLHYAKLDVLLTNLEKNSNRALNLRNMASMSQLPIGKMKAASSNLQASIKIFQQEHAKRRTDWINSYLNHRDKEEFKVKFKGLASMSFSEAMVHLELGRALTYLGFLQKSKQELNKAHIAFQQGESGFDSRIYAYKSLRTIMAFRSTFPIKVFFKKASTKFAFRALLMAKKWSKKNFLIQHELILANWLLGSAYRLNSQLNLAEQNLSEALLHCRAINYVLDEANILLDLARLRYDQKKTEEAKSLAEEALSITERCGYVLQGADVNLFLAQYALEQEQDKVKAKEYAKEALKLATCDGPPYYYKVAYDEAVAMLESLKV